MRKNALRSLIAFGLAPAVPALIVYFVAVASETQDEFSRTVLIFAALGYLAALTLGLPTYCFLNRRGIHQATPFLLAGAVIGLASEFMFVVLPVLLFKSPEHKFTVSPAAALGFSALAAASGTVAAFIFWLIAIKTAKVG